MTPEALIQLAERRGEAYTALVTSRERQYVPSTLVKSTAIDRQIDLDYKTRKEQVIYDILCSEYEIRMEEYRKQ